MCHRCQRIHIQSRIIHAPLVLARFGPIFAVRTANYLRHESDEMIVWCPTLGFSQRNEAGGCYYVDVEE